MLDGKHLMYGSLDRNGYPIWWIRSDGSSQPQKLYSAKALIQAQGVTADRRSLDFTLAATPKSTIRTLPLDLTDPDRPKPESSRIMLEEENAVGDTAVSPDRKCAVAFALPQTGKEAKTSLHDELKPRMP